MYSPTHITTLEKLLRNVDTGPLEMLVRYQYDRKVYSVTGQISGIVAYAEVEFETTDFESLPPKVIQDELSKLWPKYTEYVNEALTRSNSDLHRYL